MKISAIHCQFSKILPSLGNCLADPSKDISSVLCHMATDYKKKQVFLRRSSIRNVGKQIHLRNSSNSNQYLDSDTVERPSSSSQPANPIPIPARGFIHKLATRGLLSSPDRVYESRDNSNDFQPTSTVPLPEIAQTVSLTPTSLKIEVPSVLEPHSFLYDFCAKWFHFCIADALSWDWILLWLCREMLELFSSQWLMILFFNILGNWTWSED
jgi:hypothetical protein